MSTRRVTYSGNVYTGDTSDSVANDRIAQVLASNNWNVVNILIGNAVSAFFAVEITVNLDNSYDAASAGRYLVEQLSNAGILVGGNQFIYTDSIQQQTQQRTTQRQTDTRNMPIINAPVGAQYLGFINGFDTYKDAQGCYYYDDIYGYLPTTCPNTNILDQIGNALGFNKQGGSLNKLGWSAATGGAVALLIIAFLFTSRK